MSTTSTWPPVAGEMAVRIRDFDWSRTPLGSSAKWSERLKSAVEMTLASPLISSVVCGPQHILIYNDAAASFYGESSSGVLGRPLSQSFPSGWSTVAMHYERAFAGEVVQVTAQALDTRGEGAATDVFDAILTPVREADGQVAHVHMIGFEISKSIRAEAALRESEARLAAAFESVPVGAAVVDLSGAAMISNAEYQRFLPTGIIPSRDPARGGRWQGWDSNGRPLEPREFPGARAMRGERVVPGQEMLYTDDNGREIWTTVATAPTFDEHGRVTAVVTAISDVDLAKRSAEALRNSEERLRQFGEATQDILWIRDAETLQWEYLTPAFETIYGLTREAALRGDNMTGWLDLILPEDREHAAASLRRVHDGRWVTFEFRIRRPADGQIRWMRNTDFPMHDEAGKVIRIGGIGHDITELKRTEKALAAAELRQRKLMEGIPQLVWRSASQGAWTWASPQWLDFTGQTQEATHGQGWLDAIHPDDRALTIRAWGETRDTGTLDVEHRVHHAANSDWVWHHTRSVPVRDAEDRNVEWVGTSTDIQSLRELQERQKVLVAELQHRTRNLMGVVRATADKTSRSSADLSDFRIRFHDRLEALARVQGLLSRLNEHDRVTFDELIRAELAALDDNSQRVTVNGPLGVRLRSSTVQILAMALHELATNAVKYGALSQPQANLSVTWSFEKGGARNMPWLHIDWRETGVAMPSDVRAPRNAGQGRELIERALPYQLGANTVYELGPEGVHCVISIPVSATSRASLM